MKPLKQNALLPIDFAQNVYLNSNKRQISSNVEFEVKKMKKQQQQQTVAVVFGKQTNYTCAVSPNDPANKQTASKRTNQYLGRSSIHVSLIHQLSARRNLYIHIGGSAQANKSDFVCHLMLAHICLFTYTLDAPRQN